MPVQPCECLICQQKAVHVRAKGMTATDLAAEHTQKQRPKSFKEIVPEHYRDFKDVFNKKDFNRLPDHKPWDHAIELKPGAQPILCKAYPMAPREPTFRAYPTLQVTLGIPILLRQKERRQPSTSTGLQKAKQPHH